MMRGASKTYSSVDLFASDAGRAAGISAVSETRLALPDFYDVAIRIADVAACLPVFVLGLRDELCPSTSPLFIACTDIGDTYVHEAADDIRVGGNAKRYRWFVRGRTATN